MTEIDAYNEAIRCGQYQKPTGLQGKYDNVRRLWEDEELRLYLSPYLERLIARKKESGQRLRLLDLGCGSGDGLEFITSISESLESDIFYKGIDINERLLSQANDIYSGRENVCFVHSDCNKFDCGQDLPYDLYLANYGMLSHNTDAQTIKLLSNIAKHSCDGALIAVDWLGRYSYEWQTLWAEQWIDYVISYLHSGEKGQDLTHFPLRLMGRQDALSLYRRAKRKAGGGIALRKLADRSSFVGRHMDTAQYNPRCQPLRQVINRLFEPNLCTNLEEAQVCYFPRDGFDKANAYHERLSNCWNFLIEYTKALLGERKFPEALPEMPLTLRRCIGAMRNVVRAASKIGIGNPRASIIEPQLCYCLQELEMGLQRGLGCGHGLVAIFEVVK